MGPGVAPGIANVKLPKNKIEKIDIANDLFEILEFDLKISTVQLENK